MPRLAEAGARKQVTKTTERAGWVRKWGTSERTADVTYVSYALQQDISTSSSRGGTVEPTLQQSILIGADGEGFPRSRIHRRLLIRRRWEISTFLFYLANALTHAAAAAADSPVLLALATAAHP